MASRFDLSGKIALVAGASRGIGEAIAKALAEEGAHVICASRKVDDCEIVASAIRGSGGKAESMSLHLGDMDSIERAVATIKDTHGRVDVLVNNGATNPYFGPAHNCPLDAYEKTMQVNVRGPYFLSAKLLPMMIENGSGSIVNVASIDGLQPGHNRVVYGMTKSAVIAMTKGMSKEYGKSGVRVNALLPGFTDTRLAAGLKKIPEVKYFTDNVLSIPRIAQPEEMVGAVLLMASNAGSYITGECMVVDGGSTT